MAETIVSESLLKKAVNMFFKGIGDALLQEAEEIQKKGKPGIRLKYHSELGEDYTDIFVDLYRIKGKDKFYCDKIETFLHGSDKKVKGPKFPPAAVDDNANAITEMVKGYIDKYSDEFGTFLSDNEWKDVQNDSKKDKKTTENSEPEEEKSESSKEPNQSSTVGSKKLRMTLSPIEGSTDLSVSNIWANYSMISASDDIFALVGSPDVAALVNAEPVTVEVTQTDDDYDVEIIEAVEEDCIECTYRLAYSSLMELYCQASVQSWLEDTSYIREKLNYSCVVYVLSDALKTIVMRMKHLGLEDISMYQSKSNIVDAPLSCPEDFLNKAKDILYLLAEDLPDPTVFDREIDNINRNMTQY